MRGIDGFVVGGLVLLLAVGIPPGVFAQALQLELGGLEARQSYRLGLQEIVLEELKNPAGSSTGAVVSSLGSSAEGLGAEPAQLAAAPTLTWSEVAGEPAPSGRGGFGRWLKKRWYIPVLAAVVLGIAVSDDDDDAGEIDDD